MFVDIQAKTNELPFYTYQIGKNLKIGQFVMLVRKWKHLICRNLSYTLDGTVNLIMTLGNSLVLP